MKNPDKITTLEYILINNPKQLEGALRKLGYKKPLSHIKHFKDALKQLKDNDEKKFYQLVKYVHPDNDLFKKDFNAEGDDKTAETKVEKETKEEPKTEQEKTKTGLSPQATNIMIGAGIAIVGISLFASIFRMSKS